MTPPDTKTDLQTVRNTENRGAGLQEVAVTRCYGDTFMEKDQISRNEKRIGHSHSIASIVMSNITEMSIFKEEAMLKYKTGFDKSNVKSN